MVMPMPRFVAPLVMLMFVAVALSGCIGGDTEPDQADPEPLGAPATFDETTGGIEGVVVDTEGLPIPQAVVGIPEAGEDTTTTESGRFAFSNLDPGTYTLFAQKLGYESKGKSVQVAAGEATTIDIELVELAITDPYTTQVIQSGLFGCGASWRPAVFFSGIAACGVLSLFLNLTQYDQFLLDWEIRDDIVGWNGSAFEMHWESNQIAGKGLWMLWEVCANDRETRFASVNGESPLRVHVNSSVVHGVIHNGTYNDDACGAADDRCNDDECAFISRVFSMPQTLGESSPADIGVTFQQRFEQIHTAFFYEPGPEDFTAIPDA